MRHTGDDLRGDGEQALAAGIRARIVAPTLFTRVESRLAASQTYGSNASQWAGAMRMSRIHPDAVRMGGRSLLVSQFIGPFVVWYAAWVLEEARRRGIQRLYFASRDGHMASEVARDLSPAFGGIECRYLHVSRQSLLLPTVTEVSREALPWLFRSYERGDLPGLLAKLEASDPETEAHWRPLAGRAGPDVTLDDPIRREQFWEILASPPVSERILARAEERRSSALEYLEEQGLLEEVPSALVDFGWSLTSQWALNRLLRQRGSRKGPVAGFYLQSNFDRPPPAEAGPAYPLFPPVPWDREKSFGAVTPHLFANVLEHTAGMADHESVHHYETIEGKAMPFSLSGPIRLRSGGFADPVLRSARDFARTHRALAVDSHSTATDATRSRVSVLLAEVLGNPPRGIVEELREIQTSADQNHRFPRPIARPLRLRDELPPGFPFRSPGGAPPPAWIEGSWVLTGSGARMAIRAYRALSGWLPWELKARIKAAAKHG